MLSKVGAAFTAKPGLDVLVGDTVVYEDEASGHRTVRFVFNHPHGIWLTECLFGNPGINGFFFRRSVFDKVGLFDNEFHICADRDFLTRAALAEVASVSLNTPRWYRAHSGSQTINRTRSNILPISIELFRMASRFLESGKRKPVTPVCPAPGTHSRAPGLSLFNSVAGNWPKLRSYSSIAAFGTHSGRCISCARRFYAGRSGSTIEADGMRIYLSHSKGPQLGSVRPAEGDRLFVVVCADWARAAGQPDIFGAGPRICRISRFGKRRSSILVWQHDKRMPCDDVQSGGF